MLAVDTNTLVYAHRREPRARRRSGVVAITGGGSGALGHRVAERLRVLQRGNKPEDLEASGELSGPGLRATCRAVRGPRSSRAIRPEGFESVLAGFARRARVRGPVIHDARIAAICVAHGVDKLLTRDRDFSLFPELTVEDPFR